MNLVPGVRQDHSHQDYQIGVMDDGKQVHMPVQESRKPFKFRFYGESKGHMWHFGEKAGQVSVESCGKPTCLVCGPKHDLRHTVIEGSAT